MKLRFNHVRATAFCVANVLITVAIAPIFAGNRVVVWGENTHGQTNTPSAATNVMAIAAGLSHSLALKADGTVLAWGQVGRTNVPPGLSNVVAIAAGRGQSLALKSDGRLVAWGVPTTAATTNIPAFFSDIVAIACGDDHNLVLRANGRVFAWGANYSGQTNIPPSLSNVVAIVAGNTGNLAIKADGTAWGSGTFTNLLNGYSNLVGGALAANGNYQGAVLRGSGSAQVWGYPDVTTNLPKVVKLVGRSPNNQAGAVWALRTDGTLTGFGANYLGQPSVYEHLTNVLTVAIGYSHHMAIVGDSIPIPVEPMLNVSFSDHHFRVQQPTTRGRSYYLEYSDSLQGEVDWQLLPPVPGSGAIRTLADPNATTDARYYRVRVDQ